MFIRSLLVMPVAVSCTLLLFSLLASLTSVRQSGIQESVNGPLFDFILVEKDSAVKLRDRTTRPLPEEIQKPEKPVLTSVKLMDMPAPESPELQVDIPDISIQANIRLEPSLKGLKGPGPESVSPVQMAVSGVEFDGNPTVLKRVSPRYPSKALRKKIQGHVVVEFVVNESGMIDQETLEIIESSPEGIFDRAVIRSIKRWRFKPKTFGGKPVAYKARQRLEFNLDR